MRPPGWAPGPQATILGVLLRPDVHDFCLQGAFVGQLSRKTGPKTAPSGHKRGRMALGHAPAAPGGRILKQNPLGHHAGCLLGMISSSHWWKLAPQNGPKRPREWPNLGFSIYDPGPVGVLKDTFSGCQPRSGPFEALFGPKRPSNGPFWD